MENILRGREVDERLNLNKTMLAEFKKAVCLLLAVLCVTLATVNTAFADTIKAEGNPHEYGDWFETVPIDIFGGKIEPGTSGEHKFSVKNTSSYTLNYELAFYGDNVAIPLQYRIKSGDEYIIGDENTWVKAATLEDSVRDYGAIPVGGNLDLVIECRWLFESGNDELDTLVGIGAPTTTYYISIFGIERDANRAPQILRSNEADLIPPKLLPIAVLLLCFIIKFIYDKKSGKRRHA